VPVDCGQLEGIANGLVNYEATTYKNVATYSCLEGFALVGPESRQCSSSGLWNKKPPE
jgi:Sushi repeat (SCR repeat)